MMILAGAVLSTFSLFAAIPLPEHPRPDWERTEWRNLNGEWDFGFATNEINRKITVPFGWGSKLSGVKDEGDTGYYRREVTVPAEWKGRRVFVVVGAADHDTTCTFAGNTLDTHVGGYTPAEFEITDLVVWGEAQPLEFKVWDPPPQKAWGSHYLYGKQGYGNCRGIWQTVYLEARGQEYLESARFTPKLDESSVAVELALGAPAKTPLTAKIELDDQVVECRFAIGEMAKKIDIALKCPHFWTLDDPYLYDVTLTLQPSTLQPSTPDIVHTYFGYRSIGVGRNANGDSYLTLNGKPVYLQLCLDQSYHPDGWYTFPSDEFMKNEILISKRLALSGNRVHIKVEVPRKLYWADKLGLLIQADVPCAWGDATEAYFREHWNCFEQMVKRDYNHPSIYQWTLFNETWGLFSNRSLAMGLASGNGGRERRYREWTQRKVAEAYAKAKALDPSRIVEDNSPCNRDHVITDVNTWHGYHPGYRWESTVAKWCAETAPGSKVNYIDGFQQRGEPMMNSECGNVWGYNGSTGDCDWSWDYHLMINAFRRHLKCAGWLYTEHHDVINEWNGYVRFDRTWKETGLEDFGMTLKDLHGKAALFFEGPLGSETAAVAKGAETVTIPVGVSLVTDEFANRKLTLSRYMWYYDANGEKQCVGSEAQAEPVGGEVTARSWDNRRLWDAEVTLPEEPAAGAIHFLLKADGEIIARNAWSFSTVPADAAMPAPVAGEWSLGATNVLDGLKVNGFGKGYFEYELEAPAEGGTFVAELSSKRKNGKDWDAEKNEGIDRMLGGGASDRGKNRNSYPMTSVADKFAANLKLYINGVPAGEQTLPDDPADHRGILSWLAQPHDGFLREAGSYGYIVKLPVAAADVKDGKVKIRLESDNGLAVYGPRFGRFPLGPRVSR